MQKKIDDGMASVRNFTAPIMDAMLETHVEAKQRVAEFNVHVGIDADADTVLVVAGASLALVVVLGTCLWRAFLHAKRRSRDRTNRLVVEMADTAPVDDGEEHELEKHGRPRSAAPGDSDMEEDHFVVGTRSKSLQQ